MLSLVAFPAGVVFLSAGSELPELAPAGMPLLVLAAVLWNVGTLFDVVDGSLARLAGTSGAAGFYLDYVFHLLFKPCFFVSLAVGVVFNMIIGPESLFNSVCGFLALVTLPFAAAANWSASSSSAEHVLCELRGKGKLPEGLPREVWLGGNDSAASVEAKRRSGFAGIIRSLAKECLSYYGQFTFFSLLLTADLVLYAHGFRGATFPCTSCAYAALVVVFLLRIPVRVARDYVRMARVDQASKGPSAGRR